MHRNVQNSDLDFDTPAMKLIRARCGEICREMDNSEWGLVYKNQSNASERAHRENRRPNLRPSRAAQRYCLEKFKSASTVVAEAGREAEKEREEARERESAVIERTRHVALFHSDSTPLPPMSRSLFFSAIFPLESCRIYRILMSSYFRGRKNDASVIKWRFGWWNYVDGS